MEVEKLGRRIVATKADVRDSTALSAALEHGVAQLGRLDIVIANAGITSFGSSDQLSEQSWQDMIDINLTGVWLTVKCAIPHLRAGGVGGSIVLISSGAGLRGYIGLPHYVTSKHGLVGLMRACALELAPESIRVNSIHPTNVDTPMLQHEAMYRKFLPAVDQPTQEQFASVAQTRNALPIPWVESLDVSNAVLFLVSDEGRYITGATLPVDAGLGIK
jgi:NAD(P)-dependent dehydrogenase (short-subunit alcohol dehydrogenase family)